MAYKKRPPWPWFLCISLFWPFRSPGQEFHRICSQFSPNARLHIRLCRLSPPSFRAPNACNKKDPGSRTSDRGCFQTLRSPCSIKQSPPPVNKEASLSISPFFFPLPSTSSLHRSLRLMCISSSVLSLFLRALGSRRVFWFCSILCTYLPQLAMALHSLVTDGWPQALGLSSFFNLTCVILAMVSSNLDQFPERVPHLYPYL